MARTKEKHEGKATTITTPSRYGSHTSMVIAECGEWVTCVDELGEYDTLKCRLDNGLADPKRYCNRGVS